MAAAYKRMDKEILLQLCDQRGIDGADKTKNQLVIALLESDEERTTLTARQGESAQGSASQPEKESPAPTPGADCAQQAAAPGQSSSLQVILQCVGDCDLDTKLQLIREHREAEREARQAERESEERRVEREIEERRVEREIEERRAERQYQLDLLRLQQAGQSTQSSNPREDRPALPSADRFPVMDKEGDLDTFLKSFERTCRQYHLPAEQWARYLTPGLKGKALDVFVDLPPEYEGDYDRIKEALIKRYHLTPEVYRKRFRTLQKGPKDSYTDALSGLRTAFHQWVQGLSVSTFPALADLMIRDQLLHICPPEVRQFVLEREPQTSEKASEYADLYVDSRVPDSRRSWKKESDNSRPASPPANRKSSGSAHDPSGRKSPSPDNRRCFVCQELGHISSSCTKRKQPDSSVSPLGSPPAVLWVSAKSQRRADNLQSVTVGNRVTTGLRDTGAEITLIRPGMVSPDDIIPGKILSVTGIGGYNPTVAMARVYLDWGAGCGMREVGVTDSIPADVLLGTDLGRMVSQYIPAKTSLDSSTVPAEPVKMSKDFGPNSHVKKELREDVCENVKCFVSTEGDPEQTLPCLAPVPQVVEMKCIDVLKCTEQACTVSGVSSQANSVPSKAAVAPQQRAQVTAGKERPKVIQAVNNSQDNSVPTEVAVTRRQSTWVATGEGCQRVSEAGDNPSDSLLAPCQHVYETVDADGSQDVHPPVSMAPWRGMPKEGNDPPGVCASLGKVCHEIAGDSRGTDSRAGVSEPGNRVSGPDSGVWLPAEPVGGLASEFHPSGSEDHNWYPRVGLTPRGSAGPSGALGRGLRSPLPYAPT